MLALTKWESVMSDFSVLSKKSDQRNGDEKSLIERTCRTLAKKDFVFLPAPTCQALLAEATDEPLSDWTVFQESWDALPTDTFMADGGNDRKRRHATLSALPSSTLFKTEAHQPHYQSLNYNTLNGGIPRHFESIDAHVLQGKTMNSLIRLGCEIFGRLQPYCPWHIEVHQFRIEANAGGVGRPTPEGIHRDGVNFVMMLMVERKNLVNGSTTIYDLDKLKLEEFTLQAPLDLAIVNDEHVYHGVTPIVQLDTRAQATRDVLVITYKRKL